jgi:glycosyltransferase involved in cell wall biosynthesis
VHEHVAPEIPMLGIVHAWHQVTMKRDDERADKNRAGAQEALERCAAVVFGSEHCRKEGLELGFSYPERQAVIPYPLQKAYTKDFEMVPTAERSGVLFLASLNERKNPIALLEAIARMPGERVTFAGEGEEEQRLRDRAAELGIDDRVQFVPHMRQTVHIKRMRKLVRTARVLCLPSLSESFGIVMIAALASGTPVVGFGPTFAEIRDRLGIEIGEPVWEGEPEEVQAGLESVLARDWDRERLRKRAVSRYSVESIASEYASLVRKIAR